MIPVQKHIKDLVPYKAGKPIKELERELGITDSVKMASNENPLGPSQLAVDAIAGELAGIHFYPDGNGFYLKKALAKKLGVDETNIFLGNGSNEAIEIIVKTFMDSSSTAVMAESSFAVYKIIVRSIGATEVVVPLRNFTHDLMGLADAITEKTRVVFIANPNNPTGTIVRQDEMDKFLNRVPDDVLIVVDEAYYEYVENSDYPDVLSRVKARNNIIVLRTFSKIYGLAGLRVGYGIGSMEVIDYMNRVRQPFNVNLLAQVGALNALKDEKHLEKSRDVNRRGKEFLCNELDQLRITYVPSEANFLLIKVANGNDVYQKLLHKGVIVRPMGVYNLPDYIRVTIGLPEQNKRFITELKKILH